MALFGDDSTHWQDQPFIRKIKGLFGGLYDQLGQLSPEFLMSLRHRYGGNPQGLSEPTMRGLEQAGEGMPMAPMMPAAPAAEPMGLDPTQQVTQAQYQQMLADQLLRQRAAQERAKAKKRRTY